MKAPTARLVADERNAVVGLITSVIGDCSRNPDGNPRQIVAGISKKEKKALGAPLLRAFIKLST